ncbi:MAG: acetamidase/formamidase family protein [Actinobacteria bacterium]|nr:acetamidase/formamidase family protein [Actinomycetota bacterium]
MPQTLIGVDLSKPADEQALPPHNRWHPDIPAVASVDCGESFRVECLDWTDGQIGDNDGAEDVRDLDLNRVHVLSGPIHVNGAEPGDLLVVDILQVGALRESEWGFTGIFARDNGGGFLDDYYPDAGKAIWDFDGIYASSRHVPGVRFPGISHPGLIGCAPSAELLAEWNRRERALFETNPDRPSPLCVLPGPENAVLGTLSGAEFDRVAAEAARTVPPREHGGNCDIKNLSHGARLYLPVYVPGAKLSMGDLHFSQGDGEITFCGAIEMAGWVDLNVDLIKGGVATYGISNPIFKPGPVQPSFGDYLVFEGLSIDEKTGAQHHLDTHIAYRRACLNAIDYLGRFGYTREQAYIILGAAPIEGRISAVGGTPAGCCTLYLPTAIFDGELTPSSTGPTPIGSGQVALCA